MTAVDHRVAQAPFRAVDLAGTVAGVVSRTRTGVVSGMSRSDRLRFRLPLIASWVVIGTLLAQESGSAIIDGGLSASVALPGFLLACACYAWLQRRTLTGRTRGRVTLTLVITAASMLSFMVSALWAGLPLAFAAIFLAFRPRWMLPVVLGLLAAIATATWFLWPHRYLVQMPIGLLAMGVTLHAFTYVSMLVRELQLTREELARTKVDEERLRIQRDLHDVLGRTLVAASLRNQVALRTLPPEASAAKAQLQQLHEVITDGQARLREITSGPVIVSLADELIAARTTLNARLGMRVQIEAAELSPGPLEKLAGALVRESTTNLLKHSRATEASISVREEPLSVVVTIVNNGAEEPLAGTRNGTGLAHLRAAVAELGGELSIDFISGGRFRLSARLPRDPQSCPDEPPAVSAHRHSTPAA